MFSLCKEWGWPFIHPDYLSRVFTERQLRDWEDYYDQCPWGEDRADWRQLANQIIWSHILVGSNKKPPSPVWPYFENDQQLDPKQIEEFTANFANDIEPKEGGGYQWKPEALERMRAMGMNPHGSDDNRPT